ncbi:MAG: enoyl-ACP reductase [Bdellovibrionota bacterium]|nr:enoyl-[acyl-carrier-protein] reductase FabI [Pseudobdellovibrionaceae bacterium]|tara:strand:- start:89576 stop:90340 length:765 start_codon:yes stop_codon:yes gene_type:complete
MIDLNGKKYVVMGIANKMSLAWFITQSLKKAGAQVAVNFLNEKMEKRVRPLAEEVNAEIIQQCDVTNADELKSFFETVKEKFGQIDGLVHAIAYAEREDLEGRFIDTSREGFLKAMDISAYSLVDVAKHAEPLMTNGGSIVTLSYLGAVRVVENYNVMGVAKAALEASVRYLAADMGPNNIRVNAISAGPIKTLSASGIRDFRSMLGKAEEQNPLRQNIDGESVGDTASFLLSPLAKHITGDVLYVDCGAQIIK